jgi:DNA (cytosine-5)-methyltransferase 1
VLTEKECLLLMGFDLEDYEKIQDKPSTLRYHVAGNSIVVNVLEEIFKKIMGGN